MQLELPRGLIAYDDSGGSARPVVCLPGLGDLRGEYRFLAPRLIGAGMRAISVDLRGHGESSSGWPGYEPEDAGQDLCALLAALDLHDAVLVGTSFGAAAAVWAAVEAAPRVAGLVLIGPALRLQPLGFAQRAALALLLRGPWAPRVWLRYMESLFPLGRPPDWPAYRRQLAATLTRPGGFAPVQAMLHSGRAACLARLDRLAVPTLVAMGSADPDFPDPAAEAHWLAGRTRGRTLMVPGAGHYPHVEALDALWPELRGFLDGLPTHAP